MHKYIIAAGRGGLCNRIRCLVSSMRIAEKQSKMLILFWPSDYNCGCRFSDLFENKITEIAQEEFQRLVKKNDFGQSYEICDTWRLLPLSEDRLPRNFSRAYLSDDGDNIDFEYYRIPLSVRENILEYLNRLILKKHITERVTDFSRNFDDNTISVSLRSWEAEGRSTLFDIRNVYKVMDKEKEGTFFVVTDSTKVLEQVKYRYKQRVLCYPKKMFHGDRKSTEGIQDALIELLLLAKNKNLKVSYLSTYSEMAWWFGGCQAKVETIPITLKGRAGIIMQRIRMKIKGVLE